MTPTTLEQMIKNGTREQAVEEEFIRTGKMPVNMAPAYWAEPTKKEQTHNMKNSVVWSNIEIVSKHARRVLLYGDPGTGKSYLAKTYGLDLNNPRACHPVMIHSDLPAAELRGHYVPNKNGGMDWHDGPATAAWRDGGRLVLDEIDKAGDDALSFLLAVLEDAPSAWLEIAVTQEILRPHENFTVWATMNGTPDDLPPALIDRFPVAVRIDAPHPKAIEALDQDLRGPATNKNLRDGIRQFGIRSFMEFQKLRKEVPEVVAGQVCFGEQWETVQKAISLSQRTDVR